MVIREADQRGDEWAVGMMQTQQADLRLWTGISVRRPTSPIKLARGSRSSTTSSVSCRRRRRCCALRSRWARRAQRSAPAKELLTLAEMSIQGPFPLMAVAGAAMHRGDGATAVAIADRAL
jgi:hypothetical protein